MKKPQNFLYRSGPMIVFRNSNGCNKSNFILPAGSDRGG